MTEKADKLETEFKEAAVEDDGVEFKNGNDFDADDPHGAFFIKLGKFLNEFSSHYPKITDEAVVVEYFKCYGASTAEAERRGKNRG